MKKKVLITGGTGLVGTRLTEMLLERGYEVAFLGRRQANIPNVKLYVWDITQSYIEDEALESADFIVHLAGAGIADKRWTNARKNEIINSRVKSISLIINKLKEKNTNVQAFISSSGISYYGSDTGEKILTETSEKGNDFLAKCTILWEKEADKLAETYSIRTVKIRTGIVLSQHGGALPKLIEPIKWGFGAALGSGKQWFSWIHIDDLCRLYIKAIEDTKMQGAYNGVSPIPIRNEKLTKLAAKVLKKTLWLPNIPTFALNLLLGEMAVAVTGSEYVTNKRLTDETNFQYNFSEIEDALTALLG